MRRTSTLARSKKAAQAPKRYPRAVRCAADRHRRAETQTFRPTLDANTSSALRDHLVHEVADLSSGQEAAQWARTALTAKNTLTAADARLLEVAFQLRLSSFEERGQGAGAASPQTPGQAASRGSAVSGRRSRNAAGVDMDRAKSAGIDKSVLPIGEARRYRDKAHLKFVASQPCLICGRRPSDPHHLRFAQKRALGRKVSDEFTVHFAGCITGRRIVPAMSARGGAALDWIRSRSPRCCGRRPALQTPRLRPAPRFRCPPPKAIGARSRRPPRPRWPGMRRRGRAADHDRGNGSDHGIAAR